MVRYLRSALIAGVFFLAGQAFAAAPAPIPPVPDSNRTQTATIVSSTPSILVNFAVYGDCSDLAVTINTTVAGYPSALWNCDSAGGLPLNTLPLPITDMRVNFTPPLTSGTVTIAGAWHPRNLTVPTAPGINRREFTQAISTLIVSNRELVAATAALGAPVFTPTLFASPPSLGNTTPNTGAFTTLSATGAMTSAVSGDVKSFGITSDGGTTMVRATTPFTFLATENIPSFVSSTHFSATFLCAKQGTFAADSTGSRTCLTAQQNVAGGTSTDYFTAGFFQINATNQASGFNEAGNWTALNAHVIIASGMNPTSGVIIEANLQTLSNVTNIRQGIRMADLASTGTWAPNDAGIAIVGTGIGFRQMLQMCDYSGGVPSANCPYGTGSEILNAGVSAVVLNSFMNFGGLSGIPTLAGILLPASFGNIGWGTRTTCCGGGKIESQTTSGGGSLLFTNGTIFLQQGGINTFRVTATGAQLVGGFLLGTGGVLVNSTTAPTISSGFGTSPSVSANNGTWAFRINVGTGGTANSGVIGLPASTTGWNCHAVDITTQSATVFLTKQTASSTTTATIGNFDAAGTAAAWVASDIIAVKCAAL